ncbi:MULTISPECIES: tight adherence pilus pseudopilin TadF [Vibrio]|uniref:tight adherence pilus pseudopilin TadF n=1 Tax=Vibrio TaxID=662 RepID=UPI0012FFEC41|nr:tight adherence pilus pseudopilin TadF [Vibrio fujianensis]NAX04087.1 ATP-binding protein [Vibrio sp. V30_P3S12P165]
MKHSRNNQLGNFTVEFAIIGVFFALLLVFSADIVVKLAYKGKLDRMSYSAVSIIKERTELAGADNFSVGETEVDTIYDIIRRSLHRTSGSFDDKKFGFQLDIVRNGVDVVLPYHRGIDCESQHPDSSLDFVTTFGRHATLYQVTLCYDTESWFGDLIGQDFSRVSSRSITMGR